MYVHFFIKNLSSAYCQQSTHNETRLEVSVLNNLVNKEPCLHKFHGTRLLLYQRNIAHLLRGMKDV